MENAQELRFKALFPNGTAYRPALVEHISSKNSEKLGLTSAFWKFFLVIFPGFNSNTIGAKDWIQFLQNKRKEYMEYKEKRKIDPLKNDSQDPLCREDPTWKQYFEDLDLIVSIKRETSRFFASIKPPQIVEDISINIVFFYMRYFDIPRYYQEIHFVACEAALLCWKEMHCAPGDEDAMDPYKVLFDERYIESDAFWVFSGATNVMYKYYDQDANEGRGFITKEFCVDLENQIIAKSKSDDIKLIKEVGCEAVYMMNWVRALFNKQFPDDWDKVLTHIFAYFPSMNFISALCEAIIQSVMKRYRQTNDYQEFSENLWHGIQSEKEIRLAIYLMKRGKPQKSVGNEIGNDLEHLVNDFDNLSSDSIIQSLDNLTDAVSSVIFLKEKVALLTPEEVDHNQEMDMQFEENEGNEPQKPALLPKASKSATADFHLLVQEDEEEKPHKLETLNSFKDVNDLFD